MRGLPRSCPLPVGRGLESGFQLLPLLGRGRRGYRSLLSLVPLGSPRVSPGHKVPPGPPDSPREGGSPAEALRWARQLGLAGCLPTPGYRVGQTRDGEGCGCTGQLSPPSPDSLRLENGGSQSRREACRLVWKALGGWDKGIPRTALFRVPSRSQSCAHFPVEGGRLQVFVAGGNGTVVHQLHTLLFEDLLT